jgi:hypothetical protein
MLPLSAYVRPLEKSIRRFESSGSALCRLTITGVESLNLSAIDCASLKLLGTTRWTLAAAPETASSRLLPGEPAAARCAPACGSDQSSNPSRCAERGFRRRTFWRSRSYVRSSSSSAAYASSSQYSSSSTMPK